MSEALLSVEDLSVGYAGRDVVRAAGFSVARGRCLGVIGESGAGKSQAFLALLGLLPDSAAVRGGARFDDSQLPRDALKLRGRRIGMIFQDPMTALTPHLTIGEQIAESLVAHRDASWRDARARAAELLARVGMSDVPRRLGQYPHELSGGMRQRAMIACALACDPELLIADEPTTALDVSVQAQILALLRQLVDAGTALVVITHDMGVIAALADDVAVMRAGVVVEQGPAARLLSAPMHEYTRTLLAATPRLETPTPLFPALEAGTPPLVANHVSVVHELRGGWRKRTLTAVDDVSLEVAAGDALGIVGESGCGKSSLARAVLRLAPAGGEIVWLGRPVQALVGDALRVERAGVQIVFQDPLASLDPVMTVAEVVAEPLRALRPALDSTARGARVLKMLAAVGLGPEFAQRRGRELSGGQCQRVAIARAMALAPKLLVCDEAVSALDVSIQAQVLALLAGLQRTEGTAIVFVSHDLAVVRQLCRRVLVMYLGRVVESGLTAEVLSRPRHPYTRMLLEAVPRLNPVEARARLSSAVFHSTIRGEAPSALERPTGCAFRSRCPSAEDRCAVTSPGTERIEDSHEVACLRWRELPN